MERKKSKSNPGQEGNEDIDSIIWVSDTQFYIGVPKLDIEYKHDRNQYFNFHCGESRTAAAADSSVLEYENK